VAPFCGAVLMTKIGNGPASVYDADVELRALGVLRMPIVENPAKTIFSPFLTIFAHLRGEPESGFARRITGTPIFTGPTVPLKMVQMV
jgi:hypothetical protein